MNLRWKQEPIAPLYRVMRTVASLGISIEDATHRFALTPVGAVLAYKLSAGINDDHFSCL